MAEQPKLEIEVRWESLVCAECKRCVPLYRLIVGPDADSIGLHRLFCRGCLLLRIRALTSVRP